MAGGNYGANFPIQAPAGASELLIGEVNRAWGLVGSGSIPFWEKWGAFVYRDTVAGAGFSPSQELMAADNMPGSVLGRLRYPNGYYKLIGCEGLVWSYKGDTEDRDFEQIAGKILLGPARAERIDGPSVPFDAVSPTADPEGDIELAVRGTFSKWSDLTPLMVLTNLLVNGRVSMQKDAAGNFRHDLQAPYTKAAGLFALNHRVNPQSASTKVFPNLIKLTKSIDENGWAALKDTINQTPDLDGVSLPNAFSAMRPLIMVATEAQWIRWAHVLGGPNIPQALLQLAATGAAGITSVLVGAAELMINPYLQALADSSVPIGKQSFVFTRGGRMPLIYREELPPFVRDTGVNGAESHKRNVRALYIQARNTALLGEPRSVYRLDEP